MKRQATEDISDLDLENLELDDALIHDADGCGSQVPHEAAVVSNRWQITGDNLPSNPNTLSTSFDQKLLSVRLPEDCFRFECQVGPIQSNIRPKSLEYENPLYKGNLVVWGDLGIARPLLKAIDQVLKFTAPTNIQREVIPVAISGKDIMATAATGSGKTAAFLLPIIERILVSPNVSQRRKDTVTGKITGGRAVTRALVLLPTRELAIQCWSMLRALCTFVPVTSSLVVGGFDGREQKLTVTRSPDIIVATPGRLLDHILNTQGVHFDHIDMLVLDEADRLLELGFRDSISEIMRALPKKTVSTGPSKKTPRGQCQTLLFSATLSGGVKELASIVLRDAVMVRMSDPTKVVNTLTQEFVKIPRLDVREAAFFSVIESTVEKSKDGISGRVIVFFNEKRQSHRIANIARVFGLPVAELNGNMNQAERMTAIADFQAGTKKYLFATDVAARGLDLPMVELVINFDLPPSIDSEIRYIHRVGRTARGGSTGRSISLYTPDEYAVVKRIIKRNISKEQRDRVFDRRISSSLCASWSSRIKSIETVIKQIDKEEKVEHEIFTSSRKITRLENMHKFESDISLRPRKQWLNNKGQDNGTQKFQHKKRRFNGESRKLS
jgi:ATP-dependent RNA helicase DDX27